jgi:hypothetical protein
MSDTPNLDSGLLWVEKLIRELAQELGYFNYEVLKKYVEVWAKEACRGYQYPYS